MPLVRKPQDPALAAPPTPGALAALSSADPEERWAAARAALNLEELARALPTEEDARVREAMFTSLARIDTVESAHHLLPLLRSDDAQLRAGALDALRMMPTAVEALLATLLQDQDADVRILSCELARNLSSEQATSMLCALLAREDQVNVCAAAIEVLAEVGSPAALPVLESCQQRFHDAPFLGFAIKIAMDRITSQSTAPRG